MENFRPQDGLSGDEGGIMARGKENFEEKMAEIFCGRIRF
jgi:hypothetical protein